MAEQRIWLVWNRDSFVWNKTQVTWNDAYILEEVVSGYKGGAPGILLDEERPWKSWDKSLEENGVSEETREQLLEIVVKVNGLDKKITRLSESKSPKVKVEHIRRTIAEVVPEVRVVAEASRIVENKSNE